MEHIRFRELDKVHVFYYELKKQQFQFIVDSLARSHPPQLTFSPSHSSTHTHRRDLKLPARGPEEGSKGAFNPSVNTGILSRSSYEIHGLIQHRVAALLVFHLSRRSFLPSFPFLFLAPFIHAAN